MRAQATSRGDAFVGCGGEVVAASAGQRCIALELYNNTGNGICGYHYDPVFPTERQLRGGEPGKDSNTLAQGTSMDEGRLPNAPSSEVASAHEGGTASRDSLPPPPNPHPEGRRPKRKQVAVEDNSQSTSGIVDQQPRGAFLAHGDSHT